jgi:hypothetical protein
VLCQSQSLKARKAANGEGRLAAVAGCLEAAGIGQQVPVAGEAGEALDGRGIDDGGLLHGVGRRAVVEHAVGGAVPGDRRAAQAFQDAELDFVRAQGVEAVEALGKTFQRFAGQAEDQVGVQVGGAVLDQPGEVGTGLVVVLAARDAFAGPRG